MNKLADHTTRARGPAVRAHTARILPQQSVGRAHAQQSDAEIESMCVFVKILHWLRSLEAGVACAEMHRRQQALSHDSLVAVRRQLDFEEASVCHGQRRVVGALLDAFGQLELARVAPAASGR